jgi:hypothetical protein
MINRRWINRRRRAGAEPGTAQLLATKLVASCRPSVIAELWLSMGETRWEPWKTM